MVLRCLKCPCLEAELASTETQLRETSTAIERYLHAFEVGTMSDTLCAPRIAELAQRRGGLTDRRNQLSTQTRASQPQLPIAAQLQALGAHLQRALRDASPDVVKQLCDEVMDRIEISPGKRAEPHFWVPDVPRPGPSLARACGTPVRMGPCQLELRCFYSNRAGQRALFTGLLHPLAAT